MPAVGFSPMKEKIDPSMPTPTGLFILLRSRDDKCSL
jgi:hypothetical protein